jgi:hypothetical protein
VNVEMAGAQNEEEDTSCAIYDDSGIGTEEEGQSETNESASSEKADVQMV